MAARKSDGARFEYQSLGVLNVFVVLLNSLIYMYMARLFYLTQTYPAIGACFSSQLVPRAVQAVSPTLTTHATSHVACKSIAYLHVDLFDHFMSPSAALLSFPRA